MGGGPETEVRLVVALDMHALMRCLSVVSVTYGIINLPVYIDLTITIERLKDLFAAAIIWDRDRVDSIGRNLCLPEFKIRQVQRNYHDPVKRKEAYLDLYTYDHPCPEWKDIAEILRLFNLSEQFDLVNETYIKGIALCL